MWENPFCPCSKSSGNSTSHFVESYITIWEAHFLWTWNISSTHFLFLLNYLFCLNHKLSSDNRKWFVFVKIHALDFYFYFFPCIYCSMLNFFSMALFLRYRYILSPYLRMNMMGMEWVMFFTSSYQKVIQRNFLCSFRKISWWVKCVTLAV